MPLTAHTLYVQTDGAVVRLDHDNVLVTLDKQVQTRVPLHLVHAIVAFGRVSFTSPLLERCARDGRSVVKMDGAGRFVYRLEGPKSGNVLLRTAQFQAFHDPARQLSIARALVAGKLYNQRQVLLRAARDASTPSAANALREVAEEMARDLRRICHMDNLDTLRGLEGVNARRYFAVFQHMLAPQVQQDFAFAHRSRRPPRDPVNGVLSFLYAVLTHDAAAAAESVGLDPQIGFLHTLRPGRPALALDLMEEMRPVLADRVALTLFNRRQLTPDDFETLPGGAVSLTDAARRTILAEYQRRKQTEVEHPTLRTRLALGLVLPLQARLMARAIRGDAVPYMPFLYRG
ncbi:CRISPR-associated endonuclease Cas1 1 [Alicyclobacillus cellulosilyticus]|uniref:CRISPR-associated endonuclease Cas1 n=1 Tax=Alicyclobacillus cellulosilyticus TaxID=1003997 RepID=A0A917NIW9_9BACL|nr:type I-C CRISPR-associated endonuclease Cas1c [Alicyclobacillus cellulosilyticus]GGJ03908.1 CRISPR-associated endonuclease Cas1 1 [Alicyclobacillus cellulosilyticus]